MSGLSLLRAQPKRQRHAVAPQLTRHIMMAMFLAFSGAPQIVCSDCVNVSRTRPKGNLLCLGPSPCLFALTEAHPPSHPALHWLTCVLWPHLPDQLIHHCGARRGDNLCHSGRTQVRHNLQQQGRGGGAEAWFGRQRRHKAGMGRCTVSGTACSVGPPPFMYIRRSGGNVVVAEHKPELAIQMQCVDQQRHL